MELRRRREIPRDSKILIILKPGLDMRVRCLWFEGPDLDGVWVLDVRIDGKSQATDTDGNAVAVWAAAYSGCTMNFDTLRADHILEIELENRSKKAKQILVRATGSPGAVQKDTKLMKTTNIRTNVVGYLVLANGEPFSWYASKSDVITEKTARTAVDAFMEANGRKGIKIEIVECTCVFGWKDDGSPVVPETGNDSPDSGGRN